ncbi:MAG TPA: ABC transporter permease [Actinomycetota bacterium]|nr:ABC transporter permease [Actinomycetota bacterium]
MRTLAFLLRRFAAQRLLGLAIVVAMGFTIGVLVAGPVYAAASREAIATAAVRTATVNVRNVRLSFYGDVTDTYDRLDTTVRDATADLSVGRYVAQAKSESRMRGARGAPISLPLLFREGAERHFTTFEGTAPAGPGEIALMEDVAERLGVGIGDTVTAIGPTDAEQALRVTATYGRPRGDDPFWFGSQTPIPEEEGADLPPGLLSREGYLALASDLGLSSQYVWDLYLDLERVPFDDAQLIPERIGRDVAALQKVPGLTDVTASTGLGALFELTRQRVADLQVPIQLVVFQVAAVALAVLAGVGSLVLSRQSFELAVLRSRGFSRGKLLAGQAIHAVLAAIVAYPLGLVLGIGLARLASRSNGPSLSSDLFPVRLTGSAQALGLLGAALGAVALVLVSVPHLRRTILEERRLVSREDRPPLARIPVELFVLPLAAFAFMELRGIEAAPTIEGASLDPMVLLTPTLVIFGASFLALRLLLYVLRRLDGRIGRSRRISTYLAGRRLGRAPGTSFAIALLLLLSVGLMVVASSYRAIVLRNQEDTAHQQVGADWRVEVDPPEQPLAALERLPPLATGVVRTVPYLEVRPRFPLTTLAMSVDPRSYERGGWWRGDYAAASEASWLDALTVEDTSVPVPEGPTPGSLSIEAEPLDGAEGIELVATVQAADGSVRELVLGELGAGYDGTVSDPEVLPGAALLSIALRTAEPTGPDAATVRIDSVNGRPAADLLRDWEPLRWRGSDASVEPSGDGVTVRVTSGVGHVLGGIAPPADPLPALVSPGIARSQDHVFRASVGGQLLEFEQVARAEHFPTAPNDFFVTSTPALLRSAARIPEAGLSLGEVWAMGEDPRPALERAGFLLRSSASAAPIQAYLAQLPPSLAVGLDGATAVGALGLVTIGVAVGLSLAQRRRAFEFASLRAMGVEGTTIARIVVLEQGVLLGFAVVAGFALGYGVLRWLLPYVGRSIGAPFPPPVLVMDRAALALALVAIAAATAIGIAVALRVLLRTSVTGILRGEAE